MKFVIASERLQRARKTLGIGWLAGIWLGLIVLSSSAQLHQWLHADATAPHHECVVTLIAKGELLLLASAGPAIEPDLTLAHPPASLRFSANAQPDVRLAPSRAPPPHLVLPN